MTYNGQPFVIPAALLFKKHKGLLTSAHSHRSVIFNLPHSLPAIVAIAAESLKNISSMNLCQMENQKVFSVSKSCLWYWIVRNGETRCESVSVLAVWWMRWTSPQWSWMKHSGNFRPISVSKEKPRKWSGSLKLLGMMRNKSLGHQKPAALQSHCRTGELGHIQVTFLIIFSVLMSYKHFQICLVWGALLSME